MKPENPKDRDGNNICICTHAEMCLACEKSMEEKELMIGKIQLPLSLIITLDFPSDYKILSLQVQNEMPCLWLIGDFVNTQKETIRVFPTGGFSRGFRNRDYIGTIQLQGYVWHYFKDRK